MGTHWEPVDPASSASVNPAPARAAVVALQVIVGLATPLALTSIGGLGIYAAPALLPLLWIAASASGKAGRWYFTVLASLLMGEVAWAVAWSLIPKLQLLLPVAAMVITPIFFLRTLRTPLGVRRFIAVVIVLSLVGFSGIASLATDSSTSRKITFERSIR